MRTGVAATLFSLLLAFAIGAVRMDAGETLYNGIVLPSPWPPRADGPALSRRAARRHPD